MQVTPTTLKKATWKKQHTISTCRHESHSSLKVSHIENYPSAGICQGLSVKVVPDESMNLNSQNFHSRTFALHIDRLEKRKNQYVDFWPFPWHFESCSWCDFAEFEFTEWNLELTIQIQIICCPYNLKLFMPGHHLMKIHFRFRIAAGLICQSDLESTSSFWYLFSDFL